MKILYDIAVLGIGHVHQRGRTGIFRVIENIAEQLILLPECDIKFCSEADFFEIKNALDYLQTNEKFLSTQFSKPKQYDEKIKFYKERIKLIQDVSGNGSISPLEKYRKKIKIKQMRIKEKFLYSRNKVLIDPIDIKQTQIYHSPFNPIPEYIKQTKIKSFFITSYDLIPILYPKFFEQDVINIIKNLLNSITLETWVLCISQSTRNDLLNYMGNKVNPERVLVTELAASELFYKSENKETNKLIRNKYNIPDTPYILSLCTLEPRKNIEQAIRAFAVITKQERIKDLNLVLVGTKGWMFDKIFEEIGKESDILSRIIITGFVKDEDLAAIYSDALMFVYPSHYEGFGLPPLEAMKCGIPVITSNTSSLPEVVGNAGIMVSPNDRDALSGAMFDIYKDPSLREDLVVKSLARASHFSWKRCAEETAAAYKLSL